MMSYMRTQNMKSMNEYVKEYCNQQMKKTIQHLQDKYYGNQMEIVPYIAKPFNYLAFFSFLSFSSFVYYTNRRLV